MCSTFMQLCDILKLTSSIGIFAVIKLSVRIAPLYLTIFICHAWKKEAVTKELHHVSGKFSSVIDLKVKLMKQFENQLPTTLTFNIGYNNCRQSEKR